MHKTNSATHLKMILKDVVSTGFQHMAALAEQLKEMNITEENIKDKTKEEIMVAQTMGNILTIINDVLHPAHDVAVSLFEDKDITEFVNYCIANQQRAIEKKLISPICKCYSCKLKEVK